MGDQVTVRSYATGLAVWLTDLLSMSLDECEREIVRGDLIECRAPAAQALREMLVIVLRRRAALWVDWRPWLAVIVIVVPIGLLLSHAARWWGLTTAINVMRYWTLWDAAYLGYPAWRADLIPHDSRVQPGVYCPRRLVVDERFRPVFRRGMIPTDPGPDGYVVSQDDPRPLWPLSLVMMWPAAYIVAITSWQRWRHKAVLV